MAVLNKVPGLPISATSAVHFMVIGGEPLGPRELWWNFVATTAERIIQPKSDWREQRFGSVANDFESTPLPD